MRLSSDIRRCVIFLGHGLDGSFAPSGTGFFCAFDNARYLVTAKHVAAGFGDDPFSFRVNKLDGGSDTFDFDPLSDGIHHPWFSLDDPSVDVAVMPFNKDFRGAGYAAMLLPDSFITQPNLEIGIGDTCYAVGLFRLLAGSKRNVPIVHTGNIALMPGDEGILVNDWRDETGRSTIESEAYLVEVANLPGLSGAPVFVRPTSYIDLGTIMEPRDRDIWRDGRADIAAGDMVRVVGRHGADRRRAFWNSRTAGSRWHGRGHTGSEIARTSPVGTRQKGTRRLAFTTGRDASRAAGCSAH
jgi:hypothetical protein